MDSTEINHLLELARIEISKEEKEKIANDLAKILDYVKQLQEVDTTGVEPMTGGTFVENILRDDEINPNKEDLGKELKTAAPKLKNDFWEIPPIF